jgi:transcription antitermination factor NusG
MPWREQLTIARGRHNRTLIPYFGRYIFFALSGAWQCVIGLRGVAGVIMNEQATAPRHVDLGELLAVHDQCDSNNIIRGEDQSASKQLKKLLSYGDTVYVDKGPFAHLKGVYDGKVGRRREAAKFWMFGGEHRVLFKAGELQMLGG